MSLPPGDLADTRIVAHPERPGCYRASLAPSWNILYVFGGATMATAIQTARAKLSQPAFNLLSAHCTYLAPVQSGDVELTARTLRRGKGAEQVAVDLYQGSPEQSCLHLVASFGPPREGDAGFTELACPDVPGPEALSTVQARQGSRMALVPYYHSIEARPVTPDTETGEPAPAQWLGWYRLKNTPRLAGGELDPAAYACAGDMIGPALRMARGKGAAPILLVSLEITLHVLSLTRSTWLLQDTRIYHAADGYVTGVVHLWDEDRKLVAHALQRAVIRPRAF
jgi:acyl-CoA thioesterase